MLLPILFCEVAVEPLTPVTIMLSPTDTPFSKNHTKAETNYTKIGNKSYILVDILFVSDQLIHDKEMSFHQ